MQEEEHKALAEDTKKRLREFHHLRCPKCGMELSEPAMLGKQIASTLLVVTRFFEETIKLYQESLKTGVDVQVGCR